MAHNNHKLLKSDPYLIVVYKHLLICRNSYQQTLENRENLDKLRQHRCDIRWLLEELQWASRKNAKWSRGQEQLGDLIDLRFELRNYYSSVFEDKSIQEVRVQFGLKHQDFHATVRALIRLFAD